jgi:hypothetical protein
VLVQANESVTYSPVYQEFTDLIELDATGQEVWRDHVASLTRLLAWPAELPWFPFASESSAEPSIASSGHLVTTPLAWYRAAVGGDLGFVFDYATLGPHFPLGVSALRGGQVVAKGLLPELVTFNGVSVFPFLAGDHAVFLAQQFHSQAGLCHPSTAGVAYIGHVDASTMYLCPISLNAFDSPIDAVALLPEQLIIGRRTVLNEGCGANQFQPFTIEAYSLPGESLSTSGWVQFGGSPGLGQRPR